MVASCILSWRLPFLELVSPTSDDRAALSSALTFTSIHPPHASLSAEGRCGTTVGVKVPNPHRIRRHPLFFYAASCSRLHRHGSESH